MSDRDLYEFEGGHLNPRTICVTRKGCTVGIVAPRSHGFAGFRIVNDNRAPTFASQREGLEWLIDKDIQRRAEEP